MIEEVLADGNKNETFNAQFSDSTFGVNTTSTICDSESLIKDLNMCVQISDEGRYSVTSDTYSTESINQQANKNNSPIAVRRNTLNRNLSQKMGSVDEADEDFGVYAESFRCSNWVHIGQDDKLELKSSSQQLSDFGNNGHDNMDGEAPSSPAADEVFCDPLSQTEAHLETPNKHTETGFTRHYMSRRKCLIQRADSQQEYHRLSTRIYDHDRQVILERSSDNEGLGLHLLDSYPTFITSVDPGSAAERAGITEGQILVSVNDHNVLTTNHVDIVKLIQSAEGSVKLCVANSDCQPVRNLQATVMSGYMFKLGNSAFKVWKSRYFTLRQDNCLYYYKNHQETDPLGAFPLGGYTISRHTEPNKEFCFKAEKFGGRTYYFSALSRDQMTSWVGALSEASIRSVNRKGSFLSVSSQNVGLPALHILKPECAGILSKLSPSRRAWWRRYCVLKDACVYYYKDKSSFSALGVIHLHGYTVDRENYPRRKFSFTLQPPEKKMRVFGFSTDNETDKQRWVEALTSSIQRWVKADQDAERV
ncbi:hypothetical protein BsWGS_14249 [Bradybaena similaris]